MKTFQMSDIDREKAARMASAEAMRKTLILQRREATARQAIADLPPATPGVTYHRVDAMVKRRRITA